MKCSLTLLLLSLCVYAHAQSTMSFPEMCIERYAAHYRVPPEFIAALIDIESNWNPQAVSSQGAMGLMQLMPSTAHRFGAAHPFDVEQNIAAGTRYVTTLMWEFHGDLRMVSAAYYAGDKWVGKKRLNYSNPDVVAYVHAVRRRYNARRFHRWDSNKEVYAR